MAIPDPRDNIFDFVKLFCNREMPPWQERIFKSQMFGEFRHDHLPLPGKSVWAHTPFHRDTLAEKYCRGAVELDYEIYRVGVVGTTVDRIFVDDVELTKVSEEHARRLEQAIFDAIYGVRPEGENHEQHEARSTSEARSEEPATHGRST